MIRIAIVEDDQSADDQLTACLEKLSLQSKEVFDLSHYPDAQQFLFAFHSQFDLILWTLKCQTWTACPQRAECVKSTATSHWSL